MFAVRREAHHLPLVAPRYKAQIFGELRVEHSQRIWPGDRLNVLKPAVVSTPDRCRFPRSAAVNHQYGCFIESRVCVGADRMSKMMVHESKSGSRAGKMLMKRILPSTLVPHGQE